MILTVQQLAQAVAVSLEDEVLPALETRSWPASRIRSSLGLLQFIIDQAEHEERALSAGNRLIRTYLQSVDGGGMEAAAAEAGKDIHALRRESEELRALLSNLIRSPRRDPQKSRNALHDLLHELEALERPIYDEAIRFLPM